MKTIFTFRMKKGGTGYMIIILILLFGFSSGLFAQLNGSYTIGPGETYTSFQAAADDLHNLGVSGPVVFNIKPGTYSEQFTLDYIPNAGENNPITFQSQTGDSTDVVIKYDAGGDADNFLVTLKRISYVTLKGMTFWALDKTYNRIITIEDYAEYLTIENCVFKGTYNTNAIIRGAHIQSENALLTHLKILHNWFSRASFGIFCNSYSKNNLYPEIKYNRFDSTGYCAVSLNIAEAPEIFRNRIKYATYGIIINTSTNATIIQSNQLTNILWVGMQFSNLKSASGFESYISNNLIAGNKNGHYGISLSGSYYLNIYHNTVMVNQDYFQARALSLENCTGSTINILNNNLVTLNDGYAIYVANTGDFNSCDYNNYYTPGRIFAYWNDAKNCEDFRSLKIASGDNAHSVFAWPCFVSETDLHARSAWLDGAGIQITEIPEDLEGNNRNNPPDIGCYEYSALADVKPPLSGIKTIGAGGDYTTLNDAILDTRIKGVSDTLKLRFLPGTYEEQCIIAPIPGASSVHPVILESASGNRDDVHIRYQASSGDDNYVLKLAGSSFLRIRNLALEALGSQYSLVFRLKGMVDSLEVDSCIISGTPQGDANPSARLVFSNYLNFHYMAFKENSILNGSTSIILNLSQHTTLPGELEVSGNIFPDNNYQPVYLSGVESPVISNNDIPGGMYGIFIGNVSQKLQIDNNYIRSKYGGGLVLNSCSLPYDQYGRIYNNFIVCDGTSPNKDAMELMNCEQIDVYYNSVSSFSNSYKSRPLSIYQAHEVRVKNNIFSNQGTEYAIYVKNSAFNTFDYNCFYSEGTNLGYWDQDCAGLDAIKTASGMNGHSVDANPGFVSDTNLHVTAAALDSAGVPVAGITEDIDGDLRNPQYPDIGADEFDWMPENHPPVAENDTTEVFRGYSVRISVLDNDSDPDQDTIHVTGTGIPAHGNITEVAFDTVRYLTPQSDFTGMDSVIYYIEDERGMKDSAWIFIKVMKSEFNIGFEFYDQQQAPLTRGRLIVAHKKENEQHCDHTEGRDVIGTNLSTVENFPMGAVTASYEPDRDDYPDLIRTYLGGVAFFREASWLDLQKDTSGVQIHALKANRISGTNTITGAMINSSDSSALDHQWVFLVDQNGAIVKFDVTDDVGKFAFDSVPAGHYYFDADFWYWPMDENNDSVVIGQENQVFSILGVLQSLKISIVISNVTGHRDLTDFSHVTVWPNPVREELFVRFDRTDDRELTVRITGMDGRLLQILHYGFVPTGAVRSIRISDLPPGVYILSVEGQKMIYRTRIIKVR